MKHALLLVTFALALAACGATPTPDGGAPAGDGGVFLDFVAPSKQPVPNSFLVTVTGEEAATGGIAFPPESTAEPYFVDGWELTFEHVLVTIDRVTLSANPDMSRHDPSMTGPVVAEAVGPWAVDLAREGALEAKELNGTAIALARLTRQDQVRGAPAFDPEAKYAFGYELATAHAGVQNVNLDEAAQAAYRAMVEKGYSVWFQGTATWRGESGAPACRQTSSSYDFARYPRQVAFSLGYRVPVTFKNCINPELQLADSRGVQSQTNAETVAQVTFHLDHPFWESLAEDSPLRFDAIAARGSVMSGAGPASFSITEADVAGLDVFAFRDAQAVAVPWRTCGPVEANERSVGSVFYDPVNVPVNPAGGSIGIRDLYDYMTYNLSTFGHLNNDGLCFPARNYASPR